MASVNFLYRSRKPNDPIEVRLSFSHEGKPYRLTEKTQITVFSKDQIKSNFKLDFYNDFILKKATNGKTDKRTLKHFFESNLKDREMKKSQLNIKSESFELQNQIIDAFNNSNIENIIEDKNWLIDLLNQKYRPIKKKSPVPENLTSFIDYYIENKLKEHKDSTKKKYRVVKNKMLRFEKFRESKILIKNINEDFKNEFDNYYTQNAYSQNTKQREFVMVKTFCLYAKFKGIETHHELESLSFKRKEVKHIFINKNEIEAIKKVKLQKEHLIAARDWLLISIYTGQRISDFMRFKKDMIRVEDEKYLIEFTQEKTSKPVSVPFTKKSRDILEKTNGEFPKAMSHQKYNLYIKEVCRLAGLDDLTNGTIKKCIIEDNKKAEKHDYRSVEVTVPKWMLVSSHIGRRTFATLNYGKVPTSYLIQVTGHSSDDQLRTYLQKGQKELVLDSYSFYE